MAAVSWSTTDEQIKERDSAKRDLTKMDNEPLDFAAAGEVLCHHHDDGEKEGKRS